MHLRARRLVTDAETVSLALRLRGALRNGAFVVSLGILVLGLTAYGVLTISARSLSKPEFSAFAAEWSMLFALSGGFFLPLEQETTRAVAARVSRGQDVGPAVLRVGALGGVIVVGLVVLLGALYRPIDDRVLDGHAGLLVALVAALPIMGALYLLRGVLAGTSRFGTYAFALSGEGTTRVVAVALLAAAGAATAGSVGLAVALAPVLVLPVIAPLVPRGQGRHTPSAWPEVTQNLGWLLIASVVAQGVANAGPVVIQLIQPANKGLAGQFLAAFVVVRLPLFFTGALQASLLPRLVHSGEQHDRRGFLAALGRMVAFVSVVGAAALLVLFVAGPAIVSLFFGSTYVVSRGALTLLGASSVLLLLAALLQSAVVALSGHRSVAVSWALAGAVFLVGCAVPLEPLLRVEVAYLVASCVIVGLLLGALARVLPREPARPAAPSERPVS